MKEGGESVQQSEGEVTGWEEVAELADGMVDGLARQAPYFRKELEVDSESAESIDGMERMVRDQVFEKVDQNQVEHVVNRALDKIDGGILLDLQEKIDDGVENGVRLAAEYYVKVLGIGEMPGLAEEKVGKSESVAFCFVPLQEGGRVRVTYDSSAINSHNGELIATIGHEFWHAWQGEEMHKKTEASSEEKLRRFLYLYNYTNYIKAEDDYAGYRKQLVETEASAFEMGITRKIKNERFKRFIDSHPEIYGNENIDGIERGMQNVFQGFRVNDFLEKVGVSAIDDFFETIRSSKDRDEIEELAGRYMNYLTDLVDVKRKTNVRITDLGKAVSDAILTDNVRADEMMISSSMLVIRDEVLLSEHTKDYSEIFLRRMPELAWRWRQDEIISKSPDSERAQLYMMNKNNLVTDRYDVKLAKGQLLSKERSKFAEALVEILIEQSIEEEIRKMPLPKRVSERLKLRSNGRMQLSKKYNVKREW